MDALRKLPDILKQHYEKVLLGLALVALLGAVLYLNSRKKQESEKLLVYSKGITHRPVKNVEPVNLEQYQTALQHARTPVAPDFSVPHNLFNPVKWQRRPDGSLLKIERGTEVGPRALTVARVSPLKLIITLDRVSGASGYLMSVTREAAPNPAFRRKLQSYVTLNGKDRYNTFTLKEVKGPPEDPTELVLELLDYGNERVTLTKDQAYERVDGFKVDLAYPPENKTFTERRVNDTISLGGEEYNIVAINQNEVVLSARSNNKRTTLKYNAAP